MKNIHVLPTDKPSRLQLSENGKFYLIDEVGFYGTSVPYYIYIISNEEIKEGDWCYRDSEIAFKMTQELLEYYESIKNSDTHKRYKIILTTAQDLIADGVQEIDNEFLEGFVKNPSCEFVEVEREN